ncbi:class I adenylate-forming enzyme family protein [Mycobacterium paragordonae]|uniref:Class I adenylate-forming enzyme family protein n=1 Tax=Mycobacterium paragordonae TaxID=1389713 RepID=A0A4R5WTG9_9MYCO|nr:class I adenylate-forming enzyme family protein [Mycobacterium paragordonae]MDP7733602.1 class I adenylate-forming enzyme family protein [Mycobacterium paragordonae]TDK96192.1 feruloyl-CoA synthetase [Mycobacterium paragordonae]TDK97676.1 feruloyl-CoA synthetase [Mycobacterium paragordonae]TDL08064.1 feruloyl-CoA synthetase [Mycobacterium paragordonae]
MNQPVTAPVPSPATSEVPANPFEDGVPFATKLTELAEQQPDDTAVTVVSLDGGVQALTFGELDARANQWGRALAARGAETGSMVAIAIPNSLHLVLATLGCWKVGAVPIPMHWDLPEWERERVRAVINPAVVVDDVSRWELDAYAATAPATPLPTAVSPTANGICSSGSTGVPKVILNLAPSLWIPQQGEPFLENWTPVPKPQRIMVPAPMYHTNGFAPLLMLLGGDHLVILEKFHAPTFVDTIERYRITNFTATPTMLSRVAALPDIGRRDLSSIVFILQGAAVMPPSLLHTWFELLSPEQVVMAYGMTENLGLTALRGDEWLSHPGSVGRGFRDTEIRILDADKRPLGPGEQGDIYLRAPMSAGYRYLGGAPPLPSTEDGFRSAGDIGHLDADGYLHITDRRADMIISGGANVFPAEVESALIGHPGIADVVVIGLSDTRWGRRVHAVIHAAHPLTEQQVIEYAKSRLAPYKVPKTVEFVEGIPRTAATKVNRSAMVAARGG